MKLRKAKNKMSEIYLGYPPDAIVSWCKEKYGKKLTPYLYCGTVNGDHEHKLEVTAFNGIIDSADTGYQLGTQTCIVNNEKIQNLDITYISADEGCTCIELGSYCLTPAASSIPSQLSTISIPTVISVGSGAFNSCNKLLEINLLNATSIGEYAFATTYTTTTLSIYLNSMNIETIMHNASVWGAPTGSTFICQDGILTIS